MKILCFSVLLLGLFIAFSESRSVKHVPVSGRGGKNYRVDVGRGNYNDENAEEKRDIFEINKDNTLIDGDILPPKDRNTLVNEAQHWPTTDIPVSYNSGLSLEAIGSIGYARTEYELRTCLSLIDRTDEKDYIEFDTLSGCYSSVGMVGGDQTISIGNGCERIGTVEHEIMHAIGIYHEQSRTDRDNYVTIELQNVEPGKEHNFNTYSYDVVDDRRVSYDYNSVMHYSDTSFSTNGEPTIVTIDPTYQDVIGQRRAFSPGDVTKINRMYNCADTRRVTNNCNFDDEATCGYFQDTTDEADWYRTLSGSSPTLPSTDGTSDVSGQGSYMLFGKSDRTGPVSGSMYSMRFKSKTTTQCLEFSYTMKVAQDSQSEINIFIATIDSITGDIVSKGNPVTTITGNHDYDWNIERLTISAPSEYKLVIGAKSESPSDIIAIDDVSVIDKPCETGYFVIHDYTALVESSVKGDYIYSPLMYTDDGYAYQIKVYPVGSSSSSYDGYMSLYYSVAMGENDDNLQWPFDNRFIRLTVVDQGPDVLSRMSQSNNFMSTSTSSAWEKPTSARNGGYGYSGFMPVSDIMNTRDFVKHDTLMISIEVKDMNSYAALAAPKSRTKTVDEDMPMALPEDEVDTVEEKETSDEWGYSPATAIMIVALSAASVFILMVIAMYFVNESNSKQINKILLSG